MRQGGLRQIRNAECRDAEIGIADLAFANIRHGRTCAVDKPYSRKAVFLLAGVVRAMKNKQS